MIRYKKLPDDIHQKMNGLKEFFETEQNIVFAYLFGGFLKDRKSPLHDIDIAIFVKNIRKLDYLDIFSRITDILGTEEVDLVVLNSAPISLSGRILQNRKILSDRDPFFRHKYESATLRKYFDFSIKERALLQRRYGIG